MATIYKDCFWIWSVKFVDIVRFKSVKLHDLNDIGLRLEEQNCFEKYIYDDNV